MTAITAAIPNAIVFLLDPQRQPITVPPYVPGSVTASNASCISIGTASDVDGEVTLRLNDPSQPSDGETLLEIFDGSLETPSRRIALVTSQNALLLESEVVGVVSRVTIEVDDLRWPSIVQIAVR